MSDSAMVTEAVCSERMKRLEERVDKIETIQEEIHALTISVERLTMTVKNMVDTQKDQSKRLDALEDKDAKMWQDVVKTVITGIVGILIGYALKQLGIFQLLKRRGGLGNTFPLRVFYKVHLVSESLVYWRGYSSGLSVGRREVTTIDYQMFIMPGFLLVT